MVHALLPHDADVAGLLALLLLTRARRDTRVAADGRLQLLEEQDRSRWHSDEIAEGAQLTRAALRRPPGRFALQSAIAAVHAEAPTSASTDSAEIVALAAVDALRDEPQLAAYGRAAAARATSCAGSGAVTTPGRPTPRRCC